MYWWKGEHVAFVNARKKKKQALLTHSNSILSSSSLSGSFPAALICLKKSIIDNVNPLTLSSDQYATSPGIISIHYPAHR